MYLVTPRSEQAKAWVNENAEIPSWAWLGCSFVVDHHMIEDLELGMREAGFTTDDIIVDHC